MPNDKASEISNTSMSTIKNIVSCLPKSSLSRNKKHTYLFNQDIFAKCSNNGNENYFTQEGEKKNNFYFSENFSNCSSCSSTSSAQKNNVTNMFGQQDYNYSAVADKSKSKFFLTFYF